MNSGKTSGLSRRQLGTGVLAVSISARALGLSPAVAKVPEKIVIARLPFNTEVTIYNHKPDFFEQEGLHVEFMRSVGGPAIIQALASGSIPIGDIGVGPALVAAARKLPLVSPGLGGTSTPSHPFDRIMVRGDSPIRTVLDLKGKRLAIHQRGTMEDLCMYALYKHYGLKQGDVEIVLVPVPNQPQVLATGQVDAIYAIPPFDAIAAQKFKARTLVNTTSFIPYIGYGTITFRQDFIDAYPVAAKSVMKAWIKLCRWVDDHAATANNMAGAELKIDKSLWPHLRLPYFVRNGLPVMPNVWHNYYLLRAGKVLDHMDDPAKLMDVSVIEPTKRITMPALDELGMQPDPVVKAMLQAQYPLLPKPADAYYSDWEKKIVGS